MALRNKKISIDPAGLTTTTTIIIIIVLNISIDIKICSALLLCDFKRLVIKPWFF